MRRLKRSTQSTGMRIKRTRRREDESREIKKLINRLEKSDEAGLFKNIPERLEIKSDMFSWIGVLDRFDSLLERIIQQGKMGILSKENAKEKLIPLVRFTRLLMKTTSSRNIYSSYDRLNELLLFPDAMVICEVLRLLCLPARKLASQKPIKTNFYVSSDVLKGLSGVKALQATARGEDKGFVSAMNLCFDEGVSEAINMRITALALLGFIEKTEHLGIGEEMLQQQFSVIGESFDRFGEAFFLFFESQARNDPHRAGKNLRISSPHSVLSRCFSTVTSASPYFENLFFFLNCIAAHPQNATAVVSAGLIPVLLEKFGAEDRHLSIACAEYLLTTFTIPHMQTIEIFFENSGHALLYAKIQNDVARICGLDCQSQVSESLHTNLKLLSLLLSPETDAIERLQNVLHGPLAHTLKCIFDNNSLFPRPVLAEATAVLTTAVHNEPTVLGHLQELGISYSLLVFLSKGPGQSADLIETFPHAFEMLCLNREGLDEFSKSGALEKYLGILVDKLCVKVLSHATLLRRTSNVLEELTRHHPELRKTLYLGLQKAVARFRREKMGRGAEQRATCTSEETDLAKMFSHLLSFIDTYIRGQSPDEVRIITKQCGLDTFIIDMIASCRFPMGMLGQQIANTISRIIKRTFEQSFEKTFFLFKKNLFALGTDMLELTSTWAKAGIEITKFFGKKRPELHVLGAFQLLLTLFNEAFLFSAFHETTKKELKKKIVMAFCSLCSEDSFSIFAHLHRRIAWQYSHLKTRPLEDLLKISKEEAAALVQADSHTPLETKNPKLAQFKALQTTLSHISAGIISFFSGLSYISSSPNLNIASIEVSRLGPPLGTFSVDCLDPPCGTAVDMFVLCRYLSVMVEQLLVIFFDETKISARPNFLAIQSFSKLGGFERLDELLSKIIAHENASEKRSCAKETIKHFVNLFSSLFCKTKAPQGTTKDPLHAPFIFQTGRRILRPLIRLLFSNPHLLDSTTCHTLLRTIADVFSADSVFAEVLEPKNSALIEEYSQRQISHLLATAAKEKAAHADALPRLFPLLEKLSSDEQLCFSFERDFLIAPFLVFVERTIGREAEDSSFEKGAHKHALAVMEILRNARAETKAFLIGHIEEMLEQHSLPWLKIIAALYEVGSAETRLFQFKRDPKKTLLILLEQDTLDEETATGFYLLLSSHVVAEEENEQTRLILEKTISILGMPEHSVFLLNAMLRFCVFASAIYGVSTNEKILSRIVALAPRCLESRDIRHQAIPAYVALLLRHVVEKEAFLKSEMSREINKRINTRNKPMDLDLFLTENTSMCLRSRYLFREIIREDFGLAISSGSADSPRIFRRNAPAPAELPDPATRNAVLNILCTVFMSPPEEKEMRVFTECLLLQLLSEMLSSLPGAADAFCRKAGFSAFCQKLLLEIVPLKLFEDITNTQKYLSYWGGYFFAILCFDISTEKPLQIHRLVIEQIIAALKAAGATIKNSKSAKTVQGITFMLNSLIKTRLGTKTAHEAAFLTRSLQEAILETNLVKIVTEMPDTNESRENTSISLQLVKIVEGISLLATKNPAKRTLSNSADGSTSSTSGEDSEGMENSSSTTEQDESLEDEYDEIHGSGFEVEDSIRVIDETSDGSDIEEISSVNSVSTGDYDEDSYDDERSYEDENSHDDDSGFQAPRQISILGGFQTIYPYNTLYKTVPDAGTPFVFTQTAFHPAMHSNHPWTSAPRDQSLGPANSNDENPCCRFVYTLSTVDTERRWAQEVGFAYGENPAGPLEEVKEKIKAMLLPTASRHEESVDADDSKSQEPTIQNTDDEGRYVDHGCDVELLESLPYDLRGEVIDQYLQTRRSFIGPETTVVVSEGFLERLSPDVRSEYLRRHENDITELEEGEGTQSNGEADAVLGSEIIRSHSSGEDASILPGNENTVSEEAYKQIEIVDKETLAGLFRRIFALRRDEETRPVFRLLGHLCSHPKTRREVARLFLHIIEEAPTTNTAMQAAISRYHDGRKARRPRKNTRRESDISLLQRVFGLFGILIERNAEFKAYFAGQFQDGWEIGGTACKHFTQSAFVLLASLADRACLAHDQQLFESYTKILAAIARDPRLRQRKHCAMPLFVVTRLLDLFSSGLVGRDSARTHYIEVLGAVAKTRQGLRHVLHVLLEQLLPPAVDEMISDLETSILSARADGMPIVEKTQKLADENVAKRKILLVFSVLQRLFFARSVRGRIKDVLVGRLCAGAMLMLWKSLDTALARIKTAAEMFVVPSVLLPLVESFFIWNKLLEQAGKGEHGAQVFVPFCERHRKMLNQLLRTKNDVFGSKAFGQLIRMPRLLDFDNKRRHFRRQLKEADRDKGRRNLQLSIRRSHIFEDSFKGVMRHSEKEFRLARLTIKYEGEEGFDEGGLTRDWFLVLSHKMLDCNYALFDRVVSERETYQPNNLSWINPDHLQYFRFIGRIVAKAIYEGNILDCHFTRAFYKHILGKAIDYRDMESTDNGFYKSLLWMLENDITDVLDLAFVYERKTFGNTEAIELKENGCNIAVTEQNKFDYVCLTAEMRLSTMIRPQIDSFLQGFEEIIPREQLQLFDEQELELLISGLPEINVDDWRNNTVYSGYSPTSPEITWFWRSVRSFTHEEKAKLVQFVTGTSNVPLEGFAHLQGQNGPQRFQIKKDFGPAERLPTAHTCFNQLDLPVYHTYEELRRKLLLAISECAGFGFA
eukprot:GHVN01063509.1.p1 GENE.GHVN01063509.1~~GHVN01063509.1.p1  ORF type:complete len:2691 (+),score=181.71 GHVN01063509.1:353-8425(+)